MTGKRIYWMKKSTPVELHAMLATLAEEYPVVTGRGRDGIQVRFVKSRQKGLSSVRKKGAFATIEYNQISMAARAVGSLLAGIETSETTVFKSLGIMLDCSRNAVMTVSHFKTWLRRLALMGYNQALLYTEDTYKLPGEPYFGYMRGAYTESELKEIDAYADSLGIEMIACIQTLGHLQQILRWAPYGGIKDTPGVMLVDCDDTYKLIEKMIALWSRVFGSRRIHIGMDETHDLGRGRFMDLFGYERGFDIFNRHVDKVSRICRKYKLRPMIWSDMYFRMGNKALDYYAGDTVIPKDVRGKIPRSVDLVYWDYYHKDKDFYVDWIKRHRDLGHEPLMASGVWTWNCLWYDHQLSLNTVKPCIEACTEEKVDEIFFTLWGDDGAFCEYDSCLAGLCLVADMAYGGGNEAMVGRKFQAICAASYHNHVALATLQYPCGPENERIQGHLLLWDDPLLGINWNNNNTVNPKWVDLARGNYEKMIQSLESPARDNKNANINHGKLLAEVIIMKLELRQALLKAYATRDRKGLEAVRKIMVPGLVSALKTLLLTFRAQWMKRNKPFGFEIIQLRLNGLIGRYEELALRIHELNRGKVQAIAELDERAPKEHGGVKWSPSSGQEIGVDCI